MTQTELEKRESALAAAGYRKSRATSRKNEYSWFKTIKDPNDYEEWLYMVEWRVWDWRKYADRDPYCAQRPYSMDLCVLVHLPDGSTVHLEHPDGPSIEEAEQLARDLYELLLSHNRKFKPK